MEVAAFAGVAFDIAIELGLPECGVVLGQRVVALRAAVPEAAVDEDGDLFADEGDIGPAWYLFVVQTIPAVAGMPEGLAEEEFGFGIAGAVRAHDARSGLRERDR